MSYLLNQTTVTITESFNDVYCHLHTNYHDYQLYFYDGHQDLLLDIAYCDD